MSDSVQAATSDLEPSSGAIAPQRLSRPSVAEMDLILGQSFKVLDDGFIRVIDYMGSDAAVVQAARVSYGEATRRVSDDRGLIRYLMRHRQPPRLRCAS